MTAILRLIWPYLLGGALLIGAYLWIDHRGYARGKAHCEAVHAKAEAKALEAMHKAQAAIDALNGRLASTSTAQQAETREIYHETQTIVQRPAYALPCGDAAVAGLLDRAADNANRSLAGEPADPAAGTAEGAAQR